MAQARGLLFGEHFSVDGTLIRAWASHKSVWRKDGADDDRRECRPITVGGDRSYDTKGFVTACRDSHVMTHGTRNINCTIVFGRLIGVWRVSLGARAEFVFVVR